MEPPKIGRGGLSHQGMSFRFGELKGCQLRGGVLTTHEDDEVAWLESCFEEARVIKTWPRNKQKTAKPASTRRVIAAMMLDETVNLQSLLSDRYLVLSDGESQFTERLKAFIEHDCLYLMVEWFMAKRVVEGKMEPDPRIMRNMAQARYIQMNTGRMAA